MATLCRVLSMFFGMPLEAGGSVALQNVGTHILHISLLIKGGCGIYSHHFDLCLHLYENELESWITFVMNNVANA